MVSGSGKLADALGLFRVPIDSDDPRLSALSPQAFEALADHSLIIPCDAPALARGILAPAESPAALRDWTEARPILAPGAICLVGAPVDTTTRCLARPSLGPLEIRKYFSPPAGGKVYDVGDILAYPDEGPAALFQRLSFVTAAAFGAKATPIVIGGDHSLTFPVLQSAPKEMGRLTLVQLDAHTDCNAIRIGSAAELPLNHANFLTYVQDHAPLVDAIVQLGTRDPTVLGTAPDSGVRVRQLCASHCDGEARVGAFLRTSLGAGPRKAYLSIDIDVLDPAYAPETTVPRVGGLSMRDVSAVLRAVFNSYEIVGVDITEVCGGDHLYNRAAHCAASILSWIVWRLRDEVGIPV